MIMTSIQGLFSFSWVGMNVSKRHACISLMPLGDSNVMSSDKSQWNIFIPQFCSSWCNYPLLLLGAMACHYVLAGAVGTSLWFRCWDTPPHHQGWGEGGEVTEWRDWFLILLNVAWKPAQRFDFSSDAMIWTQALEVLFDSEAPF